VALSDRTKDNMSGPIVTMLGELPHWLLPLATASPMAVVNNVAFVFRILSFAVFAPLLFLAFLDITAYVIARTLQAPTDRQRTLVPVVAVTTDSDKHAKLDSLDPNSGSTVSHLGRPPAHGEPISVFHFAANEALSGVGLFSPAPSRPPSPTISRLTLSPHPSDAAVLGEGAVETGVVHDGNDVLRRRTGTQVPIDADHQ